MSFEQLASRLIQLLPYALDLAGGICIAWPWLDDQRLRSLIDDGGVYEGRPQRAIRDLGQVMKQEGLSGLVRVDPRQQRIVKIGITLLCGAFAIRFYVALVGSGSH
jgi:hypothetical protein